MDRTRLYLDGGWVAPAGTDTIPVENPSTEQVIAARCRPATAADVDRAVAAARAAFAGMVHAGAGEPGRRTCAGCTTRSPRARRRSPRRSRLELGAPMRIATAIQTAPAADGPGAAPSSSPPHRRPEEKVGNSLVVRRAGRRGRRDHAVELPAAPGGREGRPGARRRLHGGAQAERGHPAGGVPALRRGRRGGLPAGVFNLVTGTGPVAGEALAAHPDVDMVSFTGSTAVGRRIAHAAADRIARVALELGGKSANVILPDADLARAVQGRRRPTSCSTPARPAAPGPGCWCTATATTRRSSSPPTAAAATRLGDPFDPATRLGPLVSRRAARPGARVHPTRAWPRAPGWSPAARTRPCRDRGYFVAPDRLRRRRPGRRRSPRRRSSARSWRSSATTTRTTRSRSPTTPGTAWPARSGRRDERAGGRVRPADAHRRGRHQRRRVQPARALRRLQAVRRRPRAGPARPRRVPAGQGDPAMTIVRRWWPGRAGAGRSRSSRDRPARARARARCGCGSPPPGSATPTCRWPTARCAPPFPLVLGHEAAGAVVAVGDGVTRVRRGDARGAQLVAAPAGECWFCGHGEPWLCAARRRGRRRPRGTHRRTAARCTSRSAWARSPRRWWSPSERRDPGAGRAALRADAALLGCAVLTGVRRGAPTPPGCARARRSPCSGSAGSGLSVLTAARAAGAGPIIAVDVAEAKEELAAGRRRHRLPASPDDDLAKAVRALTGGRGADVAIECVGRAATIRTAWGPPAAAAGSPWSASAARTTW